MRKITGFCFIILLIGIGCTETASEKTDSANTRKIVDEYFAHFNQHEWSALANMYSDSSESKDPSLGADTEIQSREDIEGRYQQLSGILPDLKAQVLNVYPSGNNHIITEFISTGTGPDGQEFKLPICTIFEIRDGLIVKDYSYYDTAPPGGAE